MPTEVELRKMQEDAVRMLEGKFHKDIVKLQWAFFVEYIKVGFTRREAVELIKYIFAPCDSDVDGE